MTCHRCHRSRSIHKLEWPMVRMTAKGMILLTQAELVCSDCAKELLKPSGIIMNNLLTIWPWSPEGIAWAIKRYKLPINMEQYYHSLRKQNPTWR